MNKPIPTQRIGADLVKALGLPKMTTSFTLRVAAGEIVTVSCEYYPEDGGIVPALAVYDLIERPAQQSSPAPDPASQHFDTWMRDCTELAHREFMERTANLPRCDGRESLAEKLKRYFGDREY